MYFSSLHFCLSFLSLPQWTCQLWLSHFFFSEAQLILLHALSYPAWLTEMERILIKQVHSPSFLPFLQASCYCPAPPLVSVLELLQCLPFSPLSLLWCWPSCNAQSSDSCDNSLSNLGYRIEKIGVRTLVFCIQIWLFFLYCCQNSDVSYVKVKSTQLQAILLGKPILHRNDESLFLQATSQEGFYPKQNLSNIWGLVCHSTSDCFHLCPSRRLGWHYQLIKQ